MIGTDAQNHGVELFFLPGILPVGQLEGSAGGKVQNIKQQQDIAFARKLREADRLTVLRRQTESRRGTPDLNRSLNGTAPQQQTGDKDDAPIPVRFVHTHSRPPVAVYEKRRSIVYSNM